MCGSQHTNLMWVTMFEVLMFLFENYMDSNAGVALKASNDTVALELERVGFGRLEIDRALDWLEGLVLTQKAIQDFETPVLVKSMRFYTWDESECLSVSGQGFLLHLEQLGILDPVTREVVIDRAMALDVCAIDLKQLRWIVLMVLFSRPECKNALMLLQEMILAEAFDVVH